MQSIIALALLVLVLLLGFTLAGVWGSLAALQYLIILGVALVAVVMGMVLYRSLLPGWVRGGHHPFVLRLAAGCAGLLIWLTLVEVWFWDHFAARLRWPLEQTLGPAALWVPPVVAIVCIAVCIHDDRRKRFRSA
jgi:hypothetical protein